MHCDYCGMLNESGRTLCYVCGMELSHCDERGGPCVVADLSRLSPGMVLRAVLDSGPLSVALGPILISRYLHSKARRKPFLVPFLNGVIPRLRLVDGATIGQLDTKGWRRIRPFLSDNGFEHITAVEDLSMARPTVLRLLLSRDRAHYCSVHANGKTGSIRCVSFSAITRERAVISIDNVWALPIDHPPNVVSHHRPGRGMGALYREFRDLVQANGGKLLTLEICNLLPVWKAIRVFTVEKGIEQALLAMQPPRGRPVRLWL